MKTQKHLRQSPLNYLGREWLTSKKWSESWGGRFTASVVGCAVGGQSPDGRLCRGLQHWRAVEMLREDTKRTYRIQHLHTHTHTHTHTHKHTHTVSPTHTHTRTLIHSQQYIYLQINTVIQYKKKRNQATRKSITSIRSWSPKCSS